MKMKRYAVVGTGGRAVSMFITPLLQGFKNCAEVAGLYDSNHDRALAAKKLVGQEISSSLEIPVYEDFSRMMDQVKPDRVIVCTMDSAHAEYVVKSLKRGAAVFCEKPLCTTLKQVRGIREAADSSPAEVRVTHNMRFDPNIEKMKEVILSGRIGKILHIQFIDLLDRFHGADYFRRWHGKMENSGGGSSPSLMLHRPDEKTENLTRPSGEGGHGGSDQKLREYLFGDSQKEDPLSQTAELEDGIQAVLVGLAVNRSISQEGKPVPVQELT